MPALFQVQSGTLDLDDVAVVTVLTPEPLRQAASSAAAIAAEKAAKIAESKRTKAAASVQADGSLIANGSFETDSKGKGWPDGWGSPKDRTMTWGKRRRESLPSPAASEAGQRK